MADVRAPQVALELGDQFELAFHVLVGRHRRLEIAWIGQAVGADGPQVRQAQRCTEVLADIAARLAIGQFDQEAHTARDHGDLLRADIDHAELGGDAQAPLLRDDQQLAIGVVEVAPLHRPVGGVQVDADAVLAFRPAVPGHRVQAVDEVRRRLRHGERRPAHLVGRHRSGAEIAVQAVLRVGLERPVHRRRADAVQPAAPVLRPRRGEGGAAELFGVQPVRHPLRRVAAFRQRAGNRLAGEVIAEAGLVVAVNAHLHFRCLQSPSPDGRGVGVRGDGETVLQIASATASICISTSLSQNRRTVKPFDSRNRVRAQSDSSECCDPSTSTTRSADKQQKSTV